jgi:hypothetical protein
MVSMRHLSAEAAAPLRRFLVRLRTAADAIQTRGV